MKSIFAGIKKTDKTAVIIFFTALILRLIYLFQISDSPFFNFPQIDSLWHHLWAGQIASGEWFGSEVFFRAPLYPYFLGVIYMFFGEGPVAPAIIQSILGSLSSVLIYLIGINLFNRKTGIIGGIISAFYAVLIYFDNELLITSLFVFLTLLIFLLTLRTAENQSPEKIFVLGIITGFAAAARPTILVILPVTVYYLLFYKTGIKGRIKSIAIKAVLLLAGIVIIILPITIRNYIVGKDLVLISYQGGVNFWIGNNERADGKTAGAPGYYKAYEEYQDNVKFSSKKTAELDLGRKLKPSEISSYWYQKGLEFIAKNPGKFASLFLKKTYFLLNSCEIESNRDIYTQRQYSSLFSVLLWHKLVGFPFGIIMPLACAGLVFCVRKWKKQYLLLFGFIVFYGAILIAFFITSRFRVPLLPYLIVLSAFAVERFTAPGKKRTQLILPLVIFLIMLVFCNTTLFGVIPSEKSRSNQAAAAVFLQKNQLDSAVVYAKYAIDENPSDPAGYDFLGTALEIKGDFHQAAEAFSKAVILSSQDSYAFAHLGYNLFKTGQYREAEAACENALKIDSSIIDAYANLGQIYRATGEKEKALEIMEKGYAVDSGDIPFLNNYSAILREAGDYHRAIEVLKKVVELGPEYLPGHTNLANLYFQTGQPEFAEQEYKKALKINPDELSTSLNLTELYIRTGRNTEALALLKKVLEKYPDNPIALKLRKMAQGVGN